MDLHFAIMLMDMNFGRMKMAHLLDYIIKNTNPEYVSFEMDIMWIHFGGGDPAGITEKIWDRWKLMHVKDLKKGTKKDLTGLTSPENDVHLDRRIGYSCNNEGSKESWHQTLFH